MPKPWPSFRQYAAEYPDRLAARRRLDGWAKLAQFLIQFTCWPALAALWYALFAEIHHLIHSALPFGEMSPPSFDVIWFSAIFGAVAPALILTNLVLWLIPPLRRANERAGEGVRGMSFKDANDGLIWLARYFVTACAIAALLGAWAPWQA